MWALVAFHLSFRALIAPAGTPRSFRGSREILLSWDCPLAAPLPFDLQRVYSREPRLPSAWRVHPPGPVPPSWFLTTSTVSSALGLRVCCTPLPAVRFDAFPASGIPSAPEGGPGWSSHFPRRGSYPSKSSPHQQPYRITAAVAFLPLLHDLLARTARPVGQARPVCRRPKPPVPSRAPARAEALARTRASNRRGVRKCVCRQSPRRLEVRAPPVAEAPGGAYVRVGRGRRGR
jgi:hypothetical protein